MSLKSAAVPAVLAAWGAVVFANYWPPFGISPEWVRGAFSTGGFPVAAGDIAGAMGTHAWHLLIAAAALLAARGLGEAARRLLRLSADSLLVSLPLGLLVLSASLLGAGLAGLLVRPVLFGFAVLGLAAGGIPRGLAPLPRPAGWPVRILLAAVALPALFGALAPEVTYDALAYHTGAPALYLKAHRIARLEHMFFTDFPLGLQMVYAFAGGLGTAADPGAAKLVHWLLGLACVGAAARVGISAAGGSPSRPSAGAWVAGAWAAAFLAATPFLTTQMMKANVDLGVVFLTSAGAWWLLRSPSPRGLVMAGLCLGGSASVKMTGAYGILAGAALLLLAERGRPGGVFRMLSFAGGCAAPLLAWLARSWLACGNPVYPFLSGLLGGVGWTGENAAIYRADMTGLTSFNVQYPLPLDRLAGPWLMVMHDGGGEAALGPFALWLIPALLLGRRDGGGAPFRLGVFTVVYWMAWFGSARDPRFFLPAWPAACALAAAALVSIGGLAGRAARLICLPPLAFAPFFAAAVCYRTLNPGPVVWGAIPRDLYRERLIPPPGKYAALARAANRLVEPGGKVLVVGDVKGAMFRPTPVYPSMFDTPHLAAWVREAESASLLRKKLRQGGVAALAVNFGGALYLKRQFGHFEFSPRERAVLARLGERYLEPLHEIREAGDLYMGLYRLRERPGPPVRIPLPGDEP